MDSFASLLVTYKNRNKATRVVQSRRIAVRSLDHGHIVDVCVGRRDLSLRTYV